jgi:hypothetical protein
MSGWRKRQIDQVMFDEGLVKLIVEEAVEAERARLQGRIETLYAMYQLASKQRCRLLILSGCHSKISPGDSQPTKSHSCRQKRFAFNRALSPRGHEKA